MPSLLLVRTAAEQHASGPVLRAAVAMALGYAEALREKTAGERYWWSAAIGEAPHQVGARVGLTSREAREGVEVLLQAGVLVAVGGQGRVGEWRLEPNVLAEHPAHAALDMEAARAALRGVGAKLAPALLLLAHVAQQADSRGELRSGLATLCEETLYGRTAVAEALNGLEAARLVERVVEGRQLMLRLATGGAAGASGMDLRPAPSAAAPASGGAVAGAFRLELNGAGLIVPRGFDVHVEAGEGGVPNVRILPRSG